MPSPYPPPNGGAIAAAAAWIEALLLGSLSTTVAVLAVAGLGFTMLQGRLPARRGIRVVLGLFILFGAPLLGRALIGIGHAGFADPVVQARALPATPVLAMPPPRRPSNHSPFDPSPAQGGGQ